MAANDAPVLQSCIPHPIEEGRLLDVVEKAKDWAIMHGAAMRSKTSFSPDALQVRFHISVYLHSMFCIASLLGCYIIVYISRQTMG